MYNAPVKQLQLQQVAVSFSYLLSENTKMARLASMSGQEQLQLQKAYPS